MILIKGIGWINRSSFGTAITDQSWDFPSMKLLHKTLKLNRIIKESIKDFGRLDNLSKLTVAATSLAILDSTSQILNDDNTDIGIIGSNYSGSLASNVDYFTDYIKSGRTLSRGSLFVYTLPSASLAASAIAFGLQGPILFTMFSGNGILSRLFEEADKTITGYNLKSLIVVYECQGFVQAFLVERSNLNVLS